MSVQGKTSRYWIFNGPKTILVDECNGDVFYANPGMVSVIRRVNYYENGGFSIFASGYFAG